MAQLSTHVLDTTRGRPAAGVAVRLEKVGADGSARAVASGTTNDDGRIPKLAPEPGGLEKGVYRIHFETGAYFTALGVQGFYPSVAITFEVREPSQHHHVPLLLNPFGFSTYRGS